jgi:citrate lyase beta subunit
MKPTLSAAVTRTLERSLAKSLREYARLYPGENGIRQPVHTVYGGAHLFKFDTARRLGVLAHKALIEYAPDSYTFACAIGLPGADSLPASPAAKSAAPQKENRAAWLAYTIYSRVVSKLEREPVEDFRVDFEDGYGNRPDAEEDGHAAQAAREMARGRASGMLPPFIGIRIKPFSEELRARSVRTLDLFLTALAKESKSKLPANFVVTLPKIVVPSQVALLADLLRKLETKLKFGRGALKLELMIETPQSILNAEGQSNLPLFLDAAGGRCVAAHFGTYDYTASCSITAAHQHMLHPACDFAKNMMQVAFAGRGIWLSDGATNILPAPPNRPAKDGASLTPAQIEENRAVVHRAWKLHYDHIQHSLITGYYQGWDLHPAQLPTRYAAVYSFFLDGLDAAGERLRNFVGKAAQATLVGDVFDDAATGQGLLNYFLRAMNCGALTETEAQERSSLTLDELRSASFMKILKNRSR